jgi:hypothetical protein
MTLKSLPARALPVSLCALALLCVSPVVAEEYSPAAAAFDPATAVAPAAAPAAPAEPATAAEPTSTDAAAEAIEKLTEDFPLATPVAAVEAPVAPLDLKGKRDYFLKATFSPEAIGRIAFTSGFSQLGGSETWGSGVGGWGHRVGARYAEHVTRRTITFGIGALRGEDPRFFRSNKDSFWARTAFQLKRTVTVQMDNGGTSVAVGKLAGTFGANAISAYWDPRRPDPLKHGLTSTGISLGTDFATRMVREFWPDMKRLFRR